MSGESNMKISRDGVHSITKNRTHILTSLSLKWQETLIILVLLIGGLYFINKDRNVVGGVLVGVSILSFAFFVSPANFDMLINITLAYYKAKNIKNTLR